MKLLGLIGLLLLLATLLSPAGHRPQHRANEQWVRQRAAPVQIVRSPWAAHAPKTVRRVADTNKQVKK